MPLSAHLATLEAWGLIHPVVAGENVEYRFRHALVHEAAYSTLLKQNRREIHLAVGEVLEANGLALEDMAPLLGFHFNEAGDARRASRYFALAGGAAAHKYAHREALSYYSQAIRAAAHAPAALFQARGQVYELQGFFDEARQDYEQSAQVARADSDLTAEWQAILSLGLLWSARDYDRSGAYCQLAFELAEKTGQPRLVARSYNRLGNWHLNVERPREAARCHNQALSIFEALGDDEGRAETLDLLGMSSMLAGDLEQGAQYYQKAIELNQRLGNRLALANVLGSQVLAAGGGYQTMTLRSSGLSRTDVSAQGEAAIRATHELGWRDGEAFVNMTLSANSQSHGRYALALQTGQDGLAIAQEIGHPQWTAANQYALGLVHYDILDLPQAVRYLEAGLVLSQQLRSQHWTRCHIGMLTLAYVDSQALDQAAAVQALDPDVRQPPESIGERLVTFGRAYLARGRGDFDQALVTLESLMAATQLTASQAAHPGQPPEPVPLLLLLRGLVYLDLDRAAQAEADFRQAIVAATQNNERPLLWRLRQALGRALACQQRPDEAAAETAQARALLAEIAEDVPDPGLRENLRHRSGLFVANC